MAQRENISDYPGKRRAMRAVLIAAAVCAAILFAGVGVHVASLHDLSASALTQQTASELSTSNTAKNTGKNAKTTDKMVAVPQLVSYIGTSRPSVMSSLGPGAAVTSTRAVNDERSAIASVTTLALTDETADESAGTPTVTLSVDSDGTVLAAGFTANLQLLGYGAISFVDAVENLHVVESLLTEAGLAVPVGSVSLPASKSQYSVYASDGITLERERCTFTGTVDQDGRTYDWSSTLTYDYSQANASGNLAYTVRMISMEIAVRE